MISLMVCPSSKGNRALSRLFTRSLCSPNTFLKVRSAFGSKYLAIVVMFYKSCVKLRFIFEIGIILHDNLQISPKIQSFDSLLMIWSRFARSVVER